VYAHLSSSFRGFPKPRSSHSAPRFTSFCIRSRASNMSSSFANTDASSERPPLPPLPKPNALLEVIDLPNMTFEKNVDIPLKDSLGLCRGNVYRPKGEGKWPVLLTCEFMLRWFMTSGVGDLPRPYCIFPIYHCYLYLFTFAWSIFFRRSLRQRRPLRLIPWRLVQGNSRFSEIRPVGLGNPSPGLLGRTGLCRVEGG